MKTKILYRLGAVIAFSCIVYACKKSDSNSNAGQSNADLQTQSDDQTQVSDETDAMYNDVNLVVVAAASVTGAGAPHSVRSGVTIDMPRPPFINPLCDATITFDTANGNHKITITYNGTSCSTGRTRTGAVLLSWPGGQHWTDQGATLTINVQDLKITRTKDNKSITLNGTHLYTNATGGNVIQLAGQDSIVHTVTSDDMSVTFDNGAKHSWHVARRRLFTYSDGIKLETTGSHTDGNVTGISEWGANRWGNSFEAVITQPLTIRQSCNLQLTSGQVQIITPRVTTTTTVGLDANGDPIGCSDVYYFKVVFDSGGKTYTYILPY